MFFRRQMTKSIYNYHYRSFLRLQMTKNYHHRSFLRLRDGVNNDNGGDDKKKMKLTKKMKLLGNGITLVNSNFKV